MKNARVASFIAIGLAAAIWAVPGVGAETPVVGGVGGRWQGTSSGTERGPCGAVTFDLRVEGGRVGGSAHSRTEQNEPAEWSIFGLVDSVGQVTLETSRLARPVERRFEHVVWTGRVGDGRMRLTQAAGSSCSTERKVELGRP